METVRPLRGTLPQSFRAPALRAVWAIAEEVENMKNRCSYLVLALLAQPIALGCGDDREIIFCDRSPSATMGACPNGGAGGAAGAGGANGGSGGVPTAGGGGAAGALMGGSGGVPGVGGTGGEAGAGGGALLDGGPDASDSGLDGGP